jgi:hypothetical protein
MIFVFAVTMASLVLLIKQNLSQSQGLDDHSIIAVSAMALFALAFMMAKICFPKIRFKN